MKRISTIFIIICLFLTIGAKAQDQRTLDTKLADVLAQMPTDDLDHLNKVMANAISYGSPFVSELTEMIIAPGTGDDTAVRFVVNSLARYASGLEDNKTKAFIEAEYLKALDKTNNKDVKAFFIRQISLVGHNSTVEKIKQYLADNKLCEPASQTLLTIKSEEAETAFLNAIASAKGKNLVTIVKALGELKSDKAHAKILSLVGTGSSNLQKVVLASLAEIGKPEAYDALLKAANTQAFQYEASNAASAFVKYAKQLGENNHLKICKKACEEIIKSNNNPELLHNKAAALQIYAKYYGSKASSILLKEVNNDDKAYRTAILVTAKNNPASSTKKWIGKAKSSKSNVKEGIIIMLGNKADETAIPFLQKNLSSSSTPVRTACLTALAKIRRTDAIPQIIEQISAGKDIDHAKSILLYLLDNEQLAPVAKALDHTTGKSKAALLDVLAAKSGEQYFDKIFSYTSDKDQFVKTSALLALKRTAKAKDLNQLIELLLKSDTKGVKPVQDAICVSVSNHKNSDAGINKVLLALDKTQKKNRFIGILPELGGKLALQKAYEVFTNGNKEFKKSAFTALSQWKDHSASTILYKICKKNSVSYRSQAFNGFVKQISGSNLLSDQKLLQLRKIMPLAANNKEKQLVISALGKIKTFLALIYTSQFIDDKNLQQTACRSIVKIALPASGKKVGFYGVQVKTILEKVEQLISGPESNYIKINIRKYINAMPKGDGFVSMFNGKDLTGWKGLVGNPITRAKMDSKTLAKKQKEANQKMLVNWSVKNGTIAFSGKGANLCSEKDYGDFEMIVDWRITKHGDSGIYLRGTPQVQVWDTSRVDVGAQVGSGGLYNNSKGISKPLMVADNPVGDWNTFYIKMIGANVTVHLNGELVVDNVPLENYWDRKLPIFPTGAIELQAHGTDLAFRDVYVREIKEEDYSLTNEEKAEGFTALFNGKNLNGWIGNKTDYLVEEGNMVIRPEKGGHGNLYTEKEYSDFVYRFEFKLTPGANNGLGIRTPKEGDAAYVGMELQILDNTAPIYANLKEYQYHGSVYGVIPSKRGFLKPVGEWNTEEVIVKGSRVTVILNGVTITDGDIKKASLNGTLDHKNHSGLQRKKGHIAFLGHGSLVWFRNIRIKNLSNN